MQSQATITTTFISLLLLSLLATRATSLPRQMLTASLQSVEHSAAPAAQSPVAVAVAAAGNTGNAVAGVMDGVVPMPLVPEELVSRESSCQPIGGRCSTADQCCSKRCLSFAAKCVS